MDRLSERFTGDSMDARNRVSGCPRKLASQVRDPPGISIGISTEAGIPDRREPTIAPPRHALHFLCIHYTWLYIRRSLASGSSGAPISLPPVEDYAAEYVEGIFYELRLYGVLRSSRRAGAGGIML